MDTVCCAAGLQLWEFSASVSEKLMAVQFKMLIQNVHLVKLFSSGVFQISSWHFVFLQRVRCYVCGLYVPRRRRWRLPRPSPDLQIKLSSTTVDSFSLGIFAFLHTTRPQNISRAHCYQSVPASQAESLEHEPLWYLGNWVVFMFGELEGIWFSQPLLESRLKRVWVLLYLLASMGA